MQNHKMSFLNVVLSVSVRFYQRFLSVLKPRTCRFYPSCSNYALWLLKFENPFLAIGKIALRIFSCNPFFQGGVAYPIVSCFKRPILLQPNNTSFVQPIIFWLVPLKNSHTSYYIIKVL
ncbi:membrane protein insertion efficiency factor YidD [Helicobacter cetorum]|uniref:membrane protein insertion efficiency factor YidD n=1 Tax=Helicobacter cetorum TaxID=138563 RepID=UPI000CF19133|nr:membrane protein insertion efficiency factor YidD [Helicobacter cetorum]